MAMFKTDQPKAIKSIKSSPLARGLSLAKVGLRAGANLGSYSLSSLLAGGKRRRALHQQMLTEQAKLLAEELGKLKGSVMKVGQVLALYGEHFLLPPEVVEVLRTLQDNSPPLEWQALQPVLEQELSAKCLAELEVDPRPLAAASLGQVHRACRSQDGRELCIKIQYPGVAEAIDSDLNTLRTLLLFSQVLPQGFNLSEMLAEVRGMLAREIDYEQELQTTARFRQLLQGDQRFRIPETFPEYSTRHILTTSYEPGLSVDGPQTQALSQVRRNRLGAAALELFLQEFFRWNLVQTDPHFGNYRIRPDPTAERDQLILLDFGAVRQFPDTFRQAYYEMVRGAFWQDSERLWKAAVDLHFMPANTPRPDLERFAEMCFLMVEPFTRLPPERSVASFFNARREYCWGASDLPQRVALAASKASLSFSFRIPPKEFIFLHRKLGGVFVFLTTLKAEFNARPLLLPYMGIPTSPTPA
jgi:predicted unusual protein kinase regulating ubiquinone biosynthesis (AarF/ABC1/UbiB family)